MTAIEASVEGSKESSFDLQHKREIYELQERLAAVEGELAEQIERGRTTGLELSAARRDLEVKEAYNLMLERVAGERQVHIETLQGQLGVTAEEVAAIKKRAQVQRRRALKAQRDKQRLRRRIDAVTADLEIELSKSSHRVADAVVAQLERHRIVYALARPALRRFARKLGVLP